MIDLRYKLVTPPGQGPAKSFSAALTTRVGPRFDNIHKQVAVQLTTTSKAIIEASITRPQERGQRKRFRETGKLTGHSGHSSAIRANVLNRGSGQLQGRGISFPDIDRLNRRAKHWRAQESGVDSVKLPTGVFLDSSGQPIPLGGGAGVFHTYREGLRAGGLSARKFGLGSRSRQARQRRVGQNPTRNAGFSRQVLWKRGEAKGYEGKFYLRGSWDQVVGDGARNITAKYDKAIQEELGQFKAR